MKTNLLITLIVTLCSQLSLGQEKSPSNKFEGEIKAFEEADKKSPPPEHAILFVGASGIKLWKTLEKDFPEHQVINRGFGGSQIADAIHFADRIVIPYKPKTILLQSGGNDINAGKSPEQVAEDFRIFVEKVRAKLPVVRILFMSLQPSPARWTQAEKQKQTNALIRKQIEAGKNMAYIDAYDAFLTADGKPREDLFVADKLHHNEAGYKIRTSLVMPFLKGEERASKKSQ
jgi:lysophospholipase L1-like esterase